MQLGLSGSNQENGGDGGWQQGMGIMSTLFLFSIFPFIICMPSANSHDAVPRHLILDHHRIMRLVFKLWGLTLLSPKLVKRYR